jgi:hypothetical protein
VRRSPAAEVTLNEHHRHRYHGQAKCEEEDDIRGVAHCVNQVGYGTKGERPLVLFACDALSRSAFVLSSAQEIITVAGGKRNGDERQDTDITTLNMSKDMTHLTAARGRRLATPPAPARKQLSLHRKAGSRLLPSRWASPTSAAWCGCGDRAPAPISAEAERSRRVSLASPSFAGWFAPDASGVLSTAATATAITDFLIGGSVRRRGNGDRDRSGRGLSSAGPD